MTECLVLPARPFQILCHFCSGSPVWGEGASQQMVLSIHDSGHAAGSVGCYATTAGVTADMSWKSHRSTDDALTEEEQQNDFVTYFITLFIPIPTSLNCHGVLSQCHPARATAALQPCTVGNTSDPAGVHPLLPSNILLVLTYRDSSLDGDGKEPYVTYMVRLAFSTWNSCIDTIIFYFVSADFQDKASRVLCCHSNSEDSPNHTKTMCHILHRGQKCS